MSLSELSPFLKYGVKMAQDMVSRVVFGVVATLTTPFIPACTVSPKSRADPTMPGIQLEIELNASGEWDITANVKTSYLDVIQDESFKPTWGIACWMADPMNNPKRMEAQNLGMQMVEGL